MMIAPDLLAAPSTQVLHRFVLNSRCLDGSAAGGFVRRGGDGNRSNAVIVWLEGGGFCDSAETCGSRAYGDGDGDGGSHQMGRGGSGKWPSECDVACTPGLLSGNCRFNPQLCEATVVLLKYCSADRWTGRRAGAHFFDGDARPYFFAGARIVEELIDALLQMPLLLSRGSTLVLGGQSAGGVGALAAMDSSGESGWLPALERRGVHVRTLLGWSVDVGLSVEEELLCRGAASLRSVRWGRSGMARDQRWTDEQQVLYAAPSVRAAYEVLSRGRYQDGAKLRPTLIIANLWSALAIGSFPVDHSSCPCILAHGAAARSAYARIGRHASLYVASCFLHGIASWHAPLLRVPGSTGSSKEEAVDPRVSAKETVRRWLYGAEMDDFVDGSCDSPPCNPGCVSRVNPGRCDLNASAHAPFTVVVHRSAARS